MVKYLTSVFCKGYGTFYYRYGEILLVCTGTNSCCFVEQVGKRTCWIQLKIEFYLWEILCRTVWSRQDSVLIPEGFMWVMRIIDVACCEMWKAAKIFLAKGLNIVTNEWLLYAIVDKGLNIHPTWWIRKTRRWSVLVVLFKAAHS